MKAKLGWGMAATVAMGGAVGMAMGGGAAAQSYPPQCTAQFGYTAKCCAASYKKTPQGAMDNTVRHAELATCSTKEREKK